MKKLIVEDEQEGLLSLLGEEVLIMTSGYFYTGKLIGVNSTCVKLENPSIVYETGGWSLSEFKDEQSMNKDHHYIQMCAIESFGKKK